MFKVAPLHSSLMLISMLGFVLTAFFLTNPNYKSWAFAFILVFAIIFIASMISMSKAPIEDGHMEKLAIHRKGHYKQKK
ncbi:MAG: hypothetical protein ABH828_03235 [archaeon]